MNPETSPLPIDFKNYNFIKLNDVINIWIPIKNKKPFIIEEFSNRNNTVLFYFYAHNISQLGDLVLNGDFENIKNAKMVFDEILDFVDFKITKDKINAMKLYGSKVEMFYFEKNDSKDENKLIRFYKKELKKDSGYNVLFYFDLTLSKTAIPIEKIKNKNKTIEKYYHYNIEDDLMHYSYSLKSDYPFEIVKTINEKEIEIEKNYLINYHKEKRTKFYKPSSVIYKNNSIFNFKYIINREDKTEKAKSILKFLDIQNPEEHSFSKNEILYFTANI